MLTKMNVPKYPYKGLSLLKTLLIVWKTWEYPRHFPAFLHLYHFVTIE